MESKGREPPVKECGQLLEARKDKKMEFSLGLLDGMQVCENLDVDPVETHFVLLNYRSITE